MIGDENVDDFLLLPFLKQRQELLRHLANAQNVVAELVIEFLLTLR